ncbi:lectin-like protein [Arenibacterium sp. CAU 1754]
MTKSFLASAVLALGLASQANASPVQWSVADGGNDHWYEVVWLGIGQITWDTANSSATSSSHQGETGYLATITSAAEQAFLNTLNHAFTLANGHNSYYVTAWLGATDLQQEGSFQWVTGEAFSYSNWNAGEPNDYYGEDYLQGWWSGDKWNDCDGGCGTHKYVVEYNAAPAPVPVPASLPLAAAGLGLMGLFGRRRKAS